jgi:hypothetical protein
MESFHKEKAGLVSAWMAPVKLEIAMIALRGRLFDIVTPEVRR